MMINMAVRIADLLTKYSPYYILIRQVVKSSCWLVCKLLDRFLPGQKGQVSIPAYSAAAMESCPTGFPATGLLDRAVLYECYWC